MLLHSLLLAMGSLSEESYQVKEARRSQRQIRNQLLEKTQLQLQRNADLSRYSTVYHCQSVVF